MVKNRFLLVLGVLSLLLVTMAISRPFSNAPESADLSWPPRPVIIPVTGFSSLDAYHQSEWTYVPLRASLEDPLVAYHHSEWSSVAIAVTGVSGLDVYRLSERTLVEAAAMNPLAEYFASERMLALIGLDKNDPLYKYHLSEWFGR